VIFACIATVAIAGCAKHFTSDAVADPYGFLSGLWHGIVFPYALLTNLVSWVLSIIGVTFLSDIQLIGRPNIGFWYYAGFAIGIFSYAGAGTNR
jgi:hypothetical protein